MEVRKAILDNRLLGYYFFFSKINTLEYKDAIKVDKRNYIQYY